METYATVHYQPMFRLLLLARSIAGGVSDFALHCKLYPLMHTLHRSFTLDFLHQAWKIGL